MIETRVVGPDEWSLWGAVRLKALADAPEAFGSSLHDWETASEQRWRRRLEEVPLNVLLMFDGVAAGQVSGTSKTDDGYVELISMWVAADVRGTGAARALVEAVTEWATSMGAAGVRLSVRRANQRAIRFYKRIGFVEVDGPGDDASELAMVRPLSNVLRTA